MLRSMYSGITGLDAHRTKLDVVGNNIANVNTSGFKRQEVTFQTLMSQTLRGATQATAGRSGLNPMQVGLGVSVASIDTDMTPGGTQPTGSDSDLAIDGDGFFMLQGSDGYWYTRSGRFTLDPEGSLVNPDRLRVVGWQADSFGNVVLNDNPQVLRFRVGQDMIPASASQNVELAKNLDANTAVGETYTTNYAVYDSLGNTRILSMTFEKTAENTWDWSSDIDGVAAGNGTLVFDTNGMLSSGGTGTLSVPASDGADVININVNMSLVSQYADPSTLKFTQQDGFGAGLLNDVYVQTNGDVVGVFSNGMSRRMGVVALANFRNPQGLNREIGTAFSQSLSSGDPNIGAAGEDGRGIIRSGVLEMSNVDLSQEFVDMITTQRGFQANAKTITTADQVIETLISLKR